MTNVMRYDPFDLLEGVMKSVLRPGYESALERRGPIPNPIPIDVAETESAYLVWADLPGLRKEDVNVAIDGNALTLSAEVKQEKAVDQGQGTENWLVNERATGSLARRISSPRTSTTRTRRRSTGTACWR